MRRFIRVTNGFFMEGREPSRTPPGGPSRTCCGPGFATTAATGGAGVSERLAVLAKAAVSLLDAMAAHVARLDEPQLGVLDLLVALAPLLRSAARPPAGPAPGRAGGPRPTGDALFLLLDLGRYDASGLRTNSTVRKALDRIAAEGGLLTESRGRAPLYTVPSRFSEARRALARALWPGRPVHGEDRPRGAWRAGTARRNEAVEESGWARGAYRGGIRTRPRGLDRWSGGRRSLWPAAGQCRCSRAGAGAGGSSRPRGAPASFFVAVTSDQNRSSDTLRDRTR